jgi:hypothetical protein
MQIAILDVPPVFAQMQRNAVGSGRFRQQCGLHGVRVGSAARLPQGRYMIDIDPES